MKGQLSLFSDRYVEDILEEYVDYSDLGKTQSMERDLNILIDFIYCNECRFSPGFVVFRNVTRGEVLGGESVFRYNHPVSF